MRYKITATGSSPITLAQAKDQVNVGAADTTFDNFLNAAIATALSLAEERAGRAFVAKTVVAAYDSFYDSWRGTQGLALPLGIPDTITSITYVDTAGAVQTLANTVYDLNDFEAQGFVFLKFAQVWPPIGCLTNAVKVTYTTKASCPDVALQAMKLIIGDIFEFRESTAPGNVRPIPLSATWLLDMISERRA